MRMYHLASMREAGQAAANAFPEGIMTANRKKLLLPQAMSEAGWNVARAREDVEVVGFHDLTPEAEFRAMLADVDGVLLWGRLRGLRPRAGAYLEDSATSMCSVDRYNPSMGGQVSPRMRVREVFQGSVCVLSE